MIAWVSAHRRAALELVGAVVLVAAGWALHRPAPRIEYRDKVVYRDRVVNHDVVRTITVKAKAKDKNRTVHKTIATAPDGSKLVTIDSATATRVDLHVGQLVAADLTHAAETTATRETEVVQTPAAPPSWELTALGGLSTDGPVYGGQVGHRALGPVWLRAQVTAGAHVTGLVGLGVEF